MSPQHEKRSAEAPVSRNLTDLSRLAATTAHIRAFVELCERGLDNRADIAGWHGTSLEAMEVAIRLGGVAPSTIAHAKAPPGHLFFYPMEAADHEPAISQRFRSTGLPGAQHYALGNARYHFLLREAGLDFERVADRLRVFEACEKVDGDPRSREAARTLVDLGILPARVPGVIGELLERRGFLIALSRSALERFDVSHGDVPGHDLKLYAPSGVPFEAIAGIEPLGDVEFRFFEELQAALARRSS